MEVPLGPKGVSAKKMAVQMLILHVKKSSVYGIEVSHVNVFKNMGL
jgi:hypothetical protein